MAWLGSLWSTYKTRVTDARQLAPHAIDEYVKGYADALAAMGGDAAKLALKAGLVDHVAPFSALQEALGTKLGMSPDRASFQQINGELYLAASGGPQTNPRAAGRIALVVVEGPIVMGPSIAGWPAERPFRV